MVVAPAIEVELPWSRVFTSGQCVDVLKQRCVGACGSEECGWKPIIDG